VVANLIVSFFYVVCSNFFFVDFMRFVGGLSVSGNKRA
jgi:hypothetical protein